MKNHIQKLLLSFALILGFAGIASAQQNVLVQTTLSAAIPVTPSSLFSSSANTVQVASATGITVVQLNSTQTLNQQSQWVLYIDREEMLVTGINGTTLFVTRGYNSTLAAPHASGTMVLYGRANWFYTADPGATPGSGTGVSGVSCTAASVFVSPYLNVRTGGQWLCSTITGTWVPGWNNAGGDFFAATATVASANGVITPSGPFFSMSGTNAITGFTTPVGFNATASGGGCFVVNPTGIWTWTAAGNIAKAGTTTATLILVTFCWDAATSKWIPSRIA